MKKTIVVLIVIILIVSGFLLFSKKSHAPTTINSDTVLFYGIGCLHCKNVDDFIEQNKITEKIQFDQLEIFANRENAKIMEERATECKLDTKNLGVPMLWNKGKCYVGDQEIIQFFKDKINAN